MREMACRELVEVITEYLAGTLPETERLRFEAHLATCPYCRIYLEQMRVTVSALGRLTEESLTSEDRQRLVELFRNWKQA
jgi:anti-sigma factor RsiW